MSINKKILQGLNEAKSGIPSNWTLNNKGQYDVDGGVEQSQIETVRGGKLKYKFGKVTGDFDCSWQLLKTLEGCPDEVGGVFKCTDNNLKSMEFSPKKVKQINCANNLLTNLEGVSKDCKEIHCNNNKLTSLEGLSKKMVFVDCTNNQRLTLDNAPSEIETFWCAEQISLSEINEKIKFKTLKGGSSEKYRLYTNINRNDDPNFVYKFVLKLSGKVIDELEVKESEYPEKYKSFNKSIDEWEYSDEIAFDEFEKHFKLGDEVEVVDLDDDTSYGFTEYTERGWVD